MTSPEEPKTAATEENKTKETVPPVETVETVKTTEATTSEATAEYLSQENKGFFGRMSEGGKKIANQAYEGLYKIPGVSRVVGKMEIAYNQFWLDRHEKKAVGLKEKMDGLDLDLSSFERTKAKIETGIESLKKLNMPGGESLQLDLKKLEQDRLKMSDKRNKIQTKFEAKENKTKLYANERDAIADKLIGRYDEKLRPLEKELKNHEACRDQVDLLCAVTEVKHKEKMEKISGLEKYKNELEQSYRETGRYDEKAIRKLKGVKALEKELAQGREEMKAEKENLARRKAEINKKIAKADAKANPYRDKRAEFGRVKAGRPLEMEVGTRKKEPDFTDTVETKGHTRGESSASSARAETREPVGSVEAGTAEEDENKLSVSTCILGLNKYLQKEFGKKDSQDSLIDAKDFFKKTGLSEDHLLDLADFKNILKPYCRVARISMAKIDKSVDIFFEKKIKARK